MKANKTTLNRAIEPFVSLFIIAALTVPSLSAAPPPGGRVAIMNVHSGLCLSLQEAPPGPERPNRPISLRPRSGAILELYRRER